MQAALPLVLEGDEGQVVALASALEGLALEVFLPDFPERAAERLADAPAWLSAVPPVPEDLRSLLLLHRGWRQIMLLACVDLARVRALATALLGGHLDDYVARYPDGADYLLSTRGMSRPEVERWLAPE